MVTKLAPKQIAGTAMGGWFLSFAMANYLAGAIATQLVVKVTVVRR